MQKPVHIDTPGIAATILSRNVALRHCQHVCTWRCKGTAATKCGPAVLQTCLHIAMSFLLLPLPTCLHRGDDDMFAAAWRVSVQRQHGKSQIHGGASKAAVWFRPSGAQACLQHAHVDRSDFCLEVAKQLAIIVTIRGGW